MCGFANFSSLGHKLPFSVQKNCRFADLLAFSRHYFVTSIFGIFFKLTSTTGCYCMYRLTEEIVWKFLFSFGEKDRVGVHLILEDWFAVAFGKTSNNIWCYFQRNITTLWAIVSAFGLCILDTLFLYQEAIKLIFHKDSKIFKIVPVAYVSSLETIEFTAFTGMLSHAFEDSTQMLQF